MIPARVVDRTAMAAGRRARAVIRADRGAPDGLLQRADPTVRVVCLVAIVIAVVSRSRIEPIVLAALAVVGLAVLSGVGVRSLVGTVAPAGVVVVVAGAPQAVFVPGTPIAGTPITGAGAVTAGVFVARALTAVMAVTVLRATTPFGTLLAVLGRFGVPGVAREVLAVTYRSVVVLFESLVCLLQARRARAVGGPETDRPIARTATLMATFFDRAFGRSARVGRAVRARGGPDTGRRPPPIEIGRWDLVVGTVTLVTITGVALV